MKHTIGNNEYEIIDSWSDLMLWQYIEYAKLNIPTNQENSYLQSAKAFEDNIRIVEILTGSQQGSLDDLSINDFNELSQLVYSKIKELAPISDKDFKLKPTFEFGFLGAYNNDRGVIPFDRFFLGGDGLGNFSLDGREAIALRGYPNQSLSSQDGGSIYNKFSLELRHPITLAQQTKIFALAFLEGGNSYNEFTNFNPFNLKRSAGIGLRIFMPAFGLLGIDFGHGFDPLPGETNKSGWQTHFIIGQQF